MKKDSSEANHVLFHNSADKFPVGDLEDIAQALGMSPSQIDAVGLPSPSERTEVIQANETLLVRLGYKAAFDAGRPISGEFVMLAGPELTGEYARLRVTPPNQSEQDVTEITATELYGRPPDVGNGGIVFYAFLQDRTFTKEKESYPLRRERGIYKLKLRAIATRQTHRRSFADLQPSIAIWADGVKVVESTFTASGFNVTETIEREWSFQH